jgi:hypothetical protein
VLWPGRLITIEICTSGGIFGRTSSLEPASSTHCKGYEKDGSWWDYPLYDYHQQSGSALVLMSLKRCRTGAAK